MNYDPKMTLLDMLAKLSQADGLPVAAATQGIQLSKARTLTDAASMIVKAEAGTLYSLKGSSSSNAAVWLQTFDSATLPEEGAIPIHSFQIAAGADFAYDFTLPYGMYFSNGLVWCASTDRETKVIASSVLWVVAQYI